MTTEAYEAEAQRMTMEVTRTSVRLTGSLTRTAWDETRHLIGNLLTRLGSGVRGDATKSIAGRVTVKTLEQVTRGGRTGVDLTNPEVARVVGAELRKQGVTFAVTRSHGVARVHIAAGNAEQLDHAMQAAERVVAQRMERREARHDALSALSDRIRDLPERIAPARSSAELVALMTLGVEGHDHQANAERAALARSTYSERVAANSPNPSWMERALLDANGDVALAIQDDRFVRAVAEHLGYKPHAVQVYATPSDPLPDHTERVHPLATDRKAFDKVLDAVNGARLDHGLPKMKEKVFAKAALIDTIPPLEPIKGDAR